MAKELEYKFAVKNAEQLEQVLREAAQMAEPDGDWQVQRMQTTYFDTPSGALSAKKWTLRHRWENEQGVACLKTPSEDPQARNEFETAADAMNAQALGDLVAAGAPQSLLELRRAGAIAPLCGAKFTRRVIRVRMADGTTANLSGDVGELFAGEKRIPLCEMEVEFAQGNEQSMKEYCTVLAHQFRLHIEPKSKFARARELAAQTAKGSDIMKRES